MSSLLIVLQRLHIAPVPETGLITVASETLSHPPLPASLSSSPIILPQNPCSFSQTCQSQKQTESFPTKRLCVLVSSASNTVSTLLHLTATRLRSSPPPSTISLSSPFPAQTKLLNMFPCYSLSRYLLSYLLKLIIIDLFVFLHSSTSPLEWKIHN